MTIQKQGYLLRFVVGIKFCLIAAVLMFFNILPLPIRITIFIIGVALVATSTAPKKRAQKS